MILGLNQAHHVNMRKEREKIKMLSVNQMLVYHTVMEAYNITSKKASDQLQKKFMHEENTRREVLQIMKCMYQKKP